LGLDIYQDDFATKWFSTNAPHRNGEAVAENIRIVQLFVDSVSRWVPDRGHPNRTEEQVHLVAEVTAVEMLTRLLAPFLVVDTGDSVGFTGLLLQLRTYLDDHPHELALVYRMSGGRDRVRSLDTNTDKIDNLFQGKNPLTGPVIYPGDRRIFDDQLLSVQIHTVRIRGQESHAAAIAVRLPASMSRGVLVAAEP
jgi:hypothetical protein